MMGKITASACIILILLSLWFILTAIATFPIAETYEETKVAHGAQGFMFGTSEELNSSNSEFKIVLRDFDFDTGSINCSIIVHPFVVNVSDAENVSFLLQIPHKVDDVKVTYLAWHPDFTPFPNQNVSYVLVEIPKNNSDKHFKFNYKGSFRFDFTIENTVSKIDFYTYELNLIFETGFHHFGTERSELADTARDIDEMYFFETVRTFLHVERPENYRFFQMLPLPQRPDYWEGEPTFRWDIKSLMSEGNEIPIILSIEDSLSKDLFTWRSSISFLFLGIGIPLLISSSFETLRSKNAKLLEVLKSIRFWIILLILTVILLVISNIIFSWLKINMDLLNIDELTNMFSFEQLFYVAATIALGFFLYYVVVFIRHLERKNDYWFFILGDMIFMIFIFFFVIFPDQIPELISSLLIGELTLALIWVELSKRPELKLLDFIPTIRHVQTNRLYRADLDGRLSEPSKFLKIREARFENLNFDGQFSFTTDLSNVGYTEIRVHEYIIYLDGERQAPFALGPNPPEERLRLVTQQRHTIDIGALGIENSGLHKIRVEVVATTVKCSKEIWFYISEDFTSLRYVVMAPYHHLLSGIVESNLKSGETN